MVFLGNQIALTGVEALYTPCVKTEREKKIEAGGFVFWDEVFSEEKNDYVTTPVPYSPFIITNTLGYIAFTTLELQPNVSYNIAGHSNLISKEIYISIYVELKDFTYSHLYFTTTNSSGAFNFNFSEGDFVFPEETVIIVWSKEKGYSGSFKVVANAIPIEATLMDLIYTSVQPPTDETSGASLKLMGSTENIGDKIYTVGIYEEEYLDEATLEKQNKIIEGFNSLEGMQTLSARNIKSNEQIDSEFQSALLELSYVQQLDSNGSFNFFIQQSASGLQSVLIWGNRLMGLPEETQSLITADLIYDTVCLVGDTPILMADGTEKRLDSLKAGDLVMDIDGAPTEVLQVKRGSMNPYHTIYYFEDGYYIDETSTHRFFNVEKGFWEHLSKWEIGQHARDFNGKNHALLSKERLNESRENFGLFTESGRYFASGLLSGPARCNRELLKNATLNDAVNMVGSIKNFQAMDLLDLEEL